MDLLFDIFTRMIKNQLCFSNLARFVELVFNKVGRRGYELCPNFNLCLVTWQLGHIVDSFP